MKGFAEVLSYDDNTNMSSKESEVQVKYMHADAVINERSRKGKVNIMAMTA